MIRYQLQPSDAGVFAEIYLPKRARYQGILYKALTDGLDIEKVKTHFLTKHEDIERYIEKAKAYWDVREDGGLSDEFRLDDSIISRFPDIYYGYSMYEVDGVFRSQIPGNEAKPDEERTQVIRVMFKLDFEKQLQDVPPLAPEKREHAELLARAYLRSHHWRKEQFLGDYLALPSAKLTKSEAEQILIGMAKWSRFIGIFLFGYILYKVCEEIEALHATGQIEPEKELWVAFFWNLIITRVERLSNHDG